MRLAASPMQILDVQAPSCVQSRQFFASTLWEQLFELKNKDAIKKSHVLAKANHEQYAWPDPISWDSSFNGGVFLLIL
jgi:hypothetical protein